MSLLTFKTIQRCLKRRIGFKSTRSDERLKTSKFEFTSTKSLNYQIVQGLQRIGQLNNGFSNEGSLGQVDRRRLPAKLLRGKVLIEVSEVLSKEG